MRRGLIAGALAAAALATAGPAVASQPDLEAARAATERFHQFDRAEAEGYGILIDAQGIACIDRPGAGAMGVHYVNGALVGDPAVDAATPEVLVYEPRRNGRLRLVAVEYVVFRDAWDAEHSSPPSLFGREFEPAGAGNRYGLPPFYYLHAWVWKHNPNGMFADWNPRVSCAAA